MTRYYAEEPCEHGNVGMHNYEERALFPGCPGGSRRELTIDYEAGAIRLCHWDGLDYGEPYDEWPTVIEFPDDGPWEPRDEAIKDYMDRARAVIDAALGIPLPLREGR